MDELPKWRRGGNLSPLAISDIPAAFVSALLEADGSPERAVLILMNKYIFCLSSLHTYLEDSLNVQINFSKLTAGDMGPYVDVMDVLPLQYLKPFQLHRARLPTSVFKNTMTDIDLLMPQFVSFRGGHDYVEEMARCVAPIFNHVVAAFKPHITGTLASIMSPALRPGMVKDRDRLVSYFKAFGVIVLVIIETKRMCHYDDEYFNCIAQLVAECDACDFDNSGSNFEPSIPLHGIITDGHQFTFYRYDSTPQPQPLLHQGTLFPVATHPRADAGPLMTVLHLGPAAYMCSFRPICECVLYVFWMGLLEGMRFQLHLSLKGVTRAQAQRDQCGGDGDDGDGDGEMERRVGESEGWLEVDAVARDALDLAVQAAQDAAAAGRDGVEDGYGPGNANARFTAADDKARRAWDRIRESVDAAPLHGREPPFSIISDWNEEQVERA
ncbi:hypothetical protein Hypma_004199 [Hypsizygus marmoreus]|uniref:Uncharacterized protein n=1 Tax=Hypsizygus marmoreus TaxID=39966 RepID=A0A369J977_HYPMA|nr:hypothetical protein Hypma_004199 [Hypsizygus marmoreus]